MMHAHRPRFVGPLTLLTVAIAHAAATAQSYPIAPTVPADQPAAEILGEYVVAKQHERYIGWPDLEVLPSGELLAVFSGDRDWHVDPWGKVVAVRTADGKTWSEPAVLMDTPMDDRDPGLTVLPDGSLYLTFHGSFAYGERSGPRYDPYKDYAATITAETRARWQGFWGYRSTDGGATWGTGVKMPAMTPHGPTVLHNGRLLILGGGPVYESTDLGATWTKIGEVPKNDATWKSRNAFMSEPTCIDAGDGRIIGLARYADGNDIAVRQTESADGGRTWTEPVSTGMMGYPTQVIRLRNGWLLASYSRRLAPMGQRACLSKDNGKTWLVDEEIALSNAVKQGRGDLGYPASAQLADGSIWTVYYQVEKESDGEYPALMGTHWRLKDE